MNPIKLARYALAGWVPGGQCQCVLCGHRVWRFMPYHSGSAGAPKLMRELEIIGSDIDHFECPHCGAHDRERHLLLYLQASGVLAEMSGKAVLHFAPEKQLWRHIAGAGPNSYVRCDLYPQTPEVERVDMLDTPFEDESFDFVIANHVLEHVDDDLKALIEIRRILKFGGHAILQTPYTNKLHTTWRDAGIDTDAARLQAYGQADHVRLFGRDIFERISATGFESQVQTHEQILTGIDPLTFGVNALEPFFLFRKVH